MSVLAILTAAAAERPAISEPRSGYYYQSDEVRALQDDPFANPGLLWVDEGRSLWSMRPSASGRACADCHGNDGSGIDGVAARYPRFDAALDRVINLEQRINACRSNRQNASRWNYESTELLAMTAFVASRAAATPVRVEIDGPAAETFERGRRYYYTRRGQLNLACHQCHEQSHGKMLRGDLLSQGQASGYPAYRLEWQSLGSLHRRLRACDLGVRAEPHEAGSEAYVALELFLAWRAAGLPLETPAVRR